MRFMEKLINQCRKPSGVMGRRIAKKMNKGHAKMALWGLSHVSIEPNYYILDIGCGGGENINRFARMAVKGKIYGIDYSEISVDVSKEVNKGFIEQGLVEIYLGSVSQLPFQKNNFDLVSAFEAYYFWPDLINDLRGIYKVLKLGGSLMLTNEGYKCANEKVRKKVEKWARIGKFKIHTADEYVEFMREGGFQDIKIFEEKKEGWICAIGNKKT